MKTLLQQILSVILLFGFSLSAFAEGGAVKTGMGPGDFLVFIPFILIFYFLLWRPQSKRAKQHKELMGSLAKGDEVISSGGILGKVTKVTDEYVTIEVSSSVSFSLQKAAITAVLPKGTLKELDN